MPLNHIYRASLAELRDEEWLIQAVADAGLGHSTKREYPPQLHPYFGGLEVWQYPIQLAPYLIFLSDKEIQTYCEIGVFKGGTFAFTVAYLSRFCPVEAALAIDFKPTDAARARTNMFQGAELLADRSTSPAARQAIETMRPDLVLIDGDHTEAGCRADYQMVKDNARLIGFHDIADSTCPGVMKVWSEVQGQKQEFCRQYKEMPNHRFGLGVVEP